VTTTHLNVSTAADLSADIRAGDLASQADDGGGSHYLITLKPVGDLDGANLDGGDAYRGLFAYSGAMMIENAAKESAAASGAARVATAREFTKAML
jgi:hypothetical protein